MHVCLATLAAEPDPAPPADIVAALVVDDDRVKVAWAWDGHAPASRSVRPVFRSTGEVPRPVTTESAKFIESNEPQGKGCSAQMTLPVAV